MMSGIEKRLIGSRSLLSRVAEEGAGGGNPPHPALAGPFRVDELPAAVAATHALPLGRPQPAPAASSPPLTG